MDGNLNYTLYHIFIQIHLVYYANLWDEEHRLEVRSTPGRLYLNVCNRPAGIFAQDSTPPLLFNDTRVSKKTDKNESEY